MLKHLQGEHSLCFDPTKDTKILPLCESYGSLLCVHICENAPTVSAAFLHMWYFRWPHWLACDIWLVSHSWLAFPYWPDVRSLLSHYSNFMVMLDVKINPLCSEYFSFKRHRFIVLYFISFCDTETSKFVEICSHEKQKHCHFTWSISWLLMTWWRQAPRHQQQWYWHTCLE